MGTMTTYVKAFWRTLCALCAAIGAHWIYVRGRLDVTAAMSIGLPLLAMPWMPMALRFVANAVRDDVPPPKEAALALVRARRSSKSDEFLARVRVQDDVIEAMLEAARWAPIHTPKQPWKYHVYASESARKKLLNFLESMRIHGSTTTQRLVQEDLAGLASASHAIVISYVPLDKTEREGVPEWEELAATAASVQNMELIACAYQGVGCFWSTFGFLGSEREGARKVQAFFGFEQGEVCLGMLLVGAVESKRYKAAREPIEKRVTWVR